MSLPAPKGYYRAEAPWADTLKRIGLPDAMSVFEHPKIEVWRSITERENCILDYDTGRLHIKRNKPGRRGVDDEVNGIQLLKQAGIESTPLVAWGRLNDKRGFLITDDLAGFDDAEKRVQAGLPFEQLLGPTAIIAARLHAARLHHRDLYLCHFYVRSESNPADLRLMDAGRVRRVPRWFARRWYVKDIAQFLFSLQQLDISPELQNEWLARYTSAGGIKISGSFRRAVNRKARWIGRHDAKLRERQPTRNVAIDR